MQDEVRVKALFDDICPTPFEIMNLWECIHWFAYPDGLNLMDAFTACVDIAGGKNVFLYAHLSRIERGKYYSWNEYLRVRDRWTK